MRVSKSVKSALGTAVVVSACIAGAVSACPAAAQELQVYQRTLPALPATPEPVVQTRPRNILPDGVISFGEGSIRAAWLIGPTNRYAHGVLGDAIEASGLSVQTEDGRVLTLKLPANEVFEDRIPRLIDLNGDGQTEILLVKSHSSLGSRLTLLGEVDGALVTLAEGDPIGRAYRWLNPIGVGDFNGDRRPEIAHVETPHIGGFLVLSQWEGNRLVTFNRVEGFSNHRIGSPELGLSAIMDVNRDGVSDIVVPDNSRTRLRAVTFAGGPMQDLALVDLGAEVVSSFQVLESLGNSSPEIALQLANGQVLGLAFGR